MYIPWFIFIYFLPIQCLQFCYELVLRINASKTDLVLRINQIPKCSLVIFLSNIYIIICNNSFNIFTVYVCWKFTGKVVPVGIGILRWAHTCRWKYKVHYTLGWVLLACGGHPTIGSKLLRLNCEHCDVLRYYTSCYFILYTYATEATKQQKS